MMKFFLKKSLRDLHAAAEDKDLCPHTAEHPLPEDEMSTDESAKALLFNTG